MFRKSLLTKVIFLIFLFLPALSWAQGNIYLGRVHIQPEVTYSASWEDNIFLEHRSEENDFIQSIKPALGLEYVRDEDNYLRLGSSVEIFQYEEFKDNDYKEYEILGEGRYTSPSGFFVQARDRYLDTEDRYSTENNYRLGEAQVERWLNLAQLAVGYEANNWTAQIRYLNYILEYDEFRDEWQDRDDDRFEIRGTYRILPKTSILFMYRLEQQEYSNQDNPTENSLGIDSDTSQDNDYHQIFAGLEFSPTAKINGEIKIGAGRKDYDNHRNWNGQKYNDDWEFAAETQIRYNYSPKTTFRLELLSRTHESTDIEAASYTRTRIGLGMSQNFWQKFVFDTDLAYELEDYETGRGLPSREDDIIDLRFNLAYQIQEWLSSGLEYRYLDRTTSDSYYDDEEYTNNRFTWYIRAEL